MTNILQLYENEMPTVSMMKEGIRNSPDETIRRIDIVSVRSIRRDQLNRADVIILTRPTDYFSYRIARWAKKKNRFLIVYCDDDIYNGKRDSLIDRNRILYFRRTLALADVVETCSPRIAEKYREFTAGKRSVVSDTSIEESELYPHISGNQKIKIVYAAGASHKGLFEKNISPVIGRLYRELGDVFSLTFVGVHPELPSGEEIPVEVEYVHIMPLESYREYMRNGNFDIGVAPLDSDEFSKCKYYNKFIEYAMFGIAGLYSDTEPYTYIVKDRENGLLVKDRPDNWLIALREAITDDELRTGISVRSQQMLRERFTFEANQGVLQEKIPELQTYEAGSDVMVGPLRFSCAVLGYKVRRALLYCAATVEHLFKNGPEALLKKIREHIGYNRVYK